MATTLLEKPLLIGGERVRTGEWLEVHSPYSGETVGRVASGGAAEATAAVEAAARAMLEPLAAHERAAILARISEGIRARAEELAQVLCAEAAKPITAARIEVARASATFSAAEHAAKALAGEVVPMAGTQAGAGKLGFTLRVPVGVVGAITPFNFPLNLVSHKVAPALAAGCAVVLKPAEKTPLSAFLLAEVIEEAGLPPGWLNVVAGDPVAIGDVLVADDRVRLITFTGSSAVGWGLRERASRKKVLLELGNATPAIVLADADLDAAAQRLAASAFAFAGQACVSVQRIYVERDAYDAFLERFLPRVEALRVGDPADEATDVGPVIDAASAAADPGVDRVGPRGRCDRSRRRRRDRGRAAPADRARERRARARRLLQGGVRARSAPSTRSTRSTTRSSSRTGPRTASRPGIFTRDLGAALRAAQELEFGSVLVNETPSFRTDAMPYGGVKESGNTKEGPAAAVRELTEERLVVIQL